MWNNKLKAVTFSFDDAVTQDIRTIEILNRYGLKSTFNLNAPYLGTPGELVRNGVKVNHSKVPARDVAKVYAGHEVAVHTLTHPSLTEIEDDSTVIYQVEEDRRMLERLVGYPVHAMAYPNGAVDDRVVKLIRENTDIKFARGVESTHAFELQKDNLLNFSPSVYYIEDCLFDVAKEFLALKPDRPQLLYVWGHAYEMDAGYISWEKFEEFCALVANHDDIFYGTNSECLLCD